MNDWIVSLIKGILSSVSGPMREIIIDAVGRMEQAAAKTQNPWDDIGVGCLKWLLGL